MQWNLVKNLRADEANQWEKLVTLSLGEGVHSGRKLGFCLAREALRLSFEKVGKTLSISDLIIQDYSCLPSCPDYTLSLSHTQEVGVAVIGEVRKYRGLGIDIENQGRIVKTEILQRILNRNDIVLSGTEIWCVKEAAFKALVNCKTPHQHFEFKDILVQDQIFSHSPSGLAGKWVLEQITPYNVARAWIDI